MSADPKLDIEYVAQLARLALTDAEKQQFGEQLEEVDVTNVEPTAHAFSVVNVWQDDVPVAPLPAEAALRNAPATREQMIVVPKVVDDA